jgi:hypothetical protein
MKRRAQSLYCAALRRLTAVLCQSGDQPARNKAIARLTELAASPVSQLTTQRDCGVLSLQLQRAVPLKLLALADEVIE